MPKKVRDLLERDGRYFARLVAPKDLRPFLENRTELRTPLGSDYRAAVKAIHGAVADLQLRIRNAEAFDVVCCDPLLSSSYNQSRWLN